MGCLVRHFCHNVKNIVLLYTRESATTQWVNVCYLLIFIAKPDRRLVLFYLANDIIQNSRKKGKEFSQSFSKVLGDAMQYLRYVLEDFQINIVLRMQGFKFPVVMHPPLENLHSF